MALALRTRRRWRASLQLRVVAATLVLSVLVVGLLGFLLISQVARGLLDAKVTAAKVEAERGMTQAQSELALVDTSKDGERRICALSGTLAPSAPLSQGNAQPRLFRVAMIRTANNYACGWGTRQEIPQRLRATVQTGHARYAWTFSDILRNPEPDLRLTAATGEPGLVLGAPLTDSTGAMVELYYLFPLDGAQTTLALVQRGVLVTGAVLVLLLAGIAGLVTRQVVRPVRLAAHAAGRLSSGRLSERLPVRGEDDLAALASSFNQMAGSLQAKIHELEELSAVQRRFVADVSHELRTPLTTVRMAGEVLYDARADFTAGAARSAELLTAELDRFEGLLEDLLEISRFDAGAANLVVEAVDVAAVVRTVAQMARGVAERRGVALDLSGVPTEPVLLQADRRRLQRVLRNLVVNAVEYGEGRPVSLAVAADDHAVAIGVRDRGRGLLPGEAERLFDRFWRADPSRTRQTGGTGLGLAIALEDTRLHGGWLQPWGRPGQGAHFRLTLPRRPGSTLTASPLPLRPVDAVDESAADTPGGGGSGGLPAAPAALDAGSRPPALVAGLPSSSGSR